MRFIIIEAKVFDDFLLRHSEFDGDIGVKVVAKTIMMSAVMKSQSVNTRSST